MPTQLTALLGREIFRIRKTDETPPGVSIIDVVMAVTGGSQHDAARSLRRLSDQYPKWGQIGPTCYKRRRVVNRQENIEPFGHPC